MSVIRDIENIYHSNIVRIAIIDQFGHIEVFGLTHMILGFYFF